MDEVVHFEIPADDLERAKGFYESVFGWDLATMSMPGGGDYTSVVTTREDQATQLSTEAGAINGGMFRAQRAAANIAGHRHRCRRNRRHAAGRGGQRGNDLSRRGRPSRASARPPAFKIRRAT